MSEQVALAVFPYYVSKALLVSRAQYGKGQDRAKPCIPYLVSNVGHFSYYTLEADTVVKVLQNIVEPQGTNMVVEKGQ